MSQLNADAGRRAPATESGENLAQGRLLLIVVEAEAIVADAIASTAVASNINRQAPPMASEPRCATCQSLATPSTALYWHIGETTIRLGNVMPAKLNGENKWLCFDIRPSPR